MTENIKKNKIIELRNVTKKFGNKIILNQVNLDIYEGESLVIIGASGTGKSVLIKNIATILTPDSGEIFYNGHNIHKSKKRRREFIDNIGYLFQAGALFDSFKIWENIAFKLLQNKTSRKIAREKAIEKLYDVGLSEAEADLRPQELSGGMQKRVALARAIICNPKVIFFDEPTTGLDPVMAETIDDLIISVTKKIGATGISITHDIASVLKISDRIAMLHEGNIIWQGDKDSLKKANDQTVKNFISIRQF